MGLSDRVHSVSALSIAGWSQGIFTLRDDHSDMAGHEFGLSYQIITWDDEMPPTFEGIVVRGAPAFCRSLCVLRPTSSRALVASKHMELVTTCFRGIGSTRAYGVRPLLKITFLVQELLISQGILRT